MTKPWRYGGPMATWRRRADASRRGYRRGRSVRARGVQLVGAATYAIYLVHPFVIRTVLRLAGAVTAPATALGGGDRDDRAGGRSRLALHLALERPMTKPLRRMVRQRRSLVDQVIATDTIVHREGRMPSDRSIRRHFK